MYDINDKSAAVKSVQRYVGVSESGKYDRRTREAVTRFQLESELEATGRVDYETFVRLRERYEREGLTKRYAMRGASVRYPYTVGRYGDGVTEINSDLRLALAEYTHEYVIPHGALYTEASRAAASRLSEIYGMLDKGELDAELHARIRREILTPP